MRKIIFITLISLFSCNEGSIKDNASQQQGSENDITKEQSVNIVSPSGDVLYNYMNHPELNQNVKSYLEGTLTPGNNEETRILLDTLILHKGELVSLYFGVFNKICNKNDNSITALLGPGSIQYLENHTKFCVASLQNGAPDYFTGYIANEFSKQSPWENKFKIYTEKLYANLGNNPELIRELNLLLEGIKNDISHLEK